MFAPHIHYVSTEDSAAPMYGMIVMDFYDGTTPSAPLSHQLGDQVSEAIGLLHTNDLVFGDLRLPNIVVGVGGQQVMLVDFDWCGKGKAGTLCESIKRLNSHRGLGRGKSW